MSVCCRKYEGRSAAAVPPRVLQAAAMPFSFLWLAPKLLVPLYREQIPHRNQVPRDVGMCTSSGYQPIVGRECYGITGS